MFLTIECPDELFAEMPVAGVMTSPGAALEAVEDVPAGPWGRSEVALRLGTALSLVPRSHRRPNVAAATPLAPDRGPEPEGVDCRPGGFGADKEVALAVNEPVGAAQRRIHRDRRLRRFLPTTRTLFRHGRLSEQHVEAIVDATGSIDDPELLAAVEDRVLTAPRALAKTATELRRDVRSALTRLDPDGAQDRARDAREKADVMLLPADDGMATVVMDAPVEDSLTVKAAADAYAATVKNAGDDRRVGVLRAEGLARICGDYLTGTSTAGSLPRAGGRPIEIGIVVDLDTALGHRDLPAEVPGHGIVPREVVADMIAAELPKLRLMVTDNGRLVHRAVDAYRPTAEQIAHVRAEYVFSVGPGSQVPAARTDTDHATPYPAGPTCIGNLVPNDRTWHNGHTRRQLSVTVDDTGTVTWTSVLGQTRTVTPYDYRTESPPAEADPPPF